MIPKLEPHSIERINGDTVGANARWMRVTRAGHLYLYSWPWKIKAIFREGTWIAVICGIAPGDLEKAVQ